MCQKVLLVCLVSGIYTQNASANFFEKLNNNIEKINNDLNSAKEKIESLPFTKKEEKEDQNNVKNDKNTTPLNTVKVVDSKPSVSSSNVTSKEKKSANHAKVYYVEYPAPDITNAAKYIFPKYKGKQILWSDTEKTYFLMRKMNMTGKNGKLKEVGSIESYKLLGKLKLMAPYLDKEKLIKWFDNYNKDLSYNDTNDHNFYYQMGLFIEVLARKTSLPGTFNRFGGASSNEFARRESFKNFLDNDLEKYLAWAESIQFEGDFLYFEKFGQQLEFDFSNERYTTRHSSPLVGLSLHADAKDLIKSNLLELNIKDRRNFSFHVDANTANKIESSFQNKSWTITGSGRW